MLYKLECRCRQRPVSTSGRCFARNRFYAAAGERGVDQPGVVGIKEFNLT